MTTQVPTTLISGPLGGVVPINTPVTVSDVPTVDFELTGSYDRYVLNADGVRPATDGVTLEALVHASGSWVTSASYGSTHSSATGSTSMQVVPGGQVGNTGGETLSGTFFIHLPHDTGVYTLVSVLYALTNATTGGISGSGAGQHFGYLGTDAVDKFRLRMSSGNIASGRFQLYGMATG